MNYDKKIVKHYAKLCALSQGIDKKNPDLLQTANLITAFSLYYLNASKPAFNAEKLYDILKPHLSVENFSLENPNGFLTAQSVLSALIYYRKITGEYVNDAFIHELYNKTLTRVLSAIIDKDENFYYALASADCVADYLSTFNKQDDKNLFAKIKDSLSDRNPIADNALCELYLKCAIGIFKYDDKNSNDVSFSEDMLQTVYSNSISLNYAVGKTLLAPQVASPSATALALKLSVMLYKFLGKEVHQTFMRRIWFNGMQFCQRFSGGVGYDTFVTFDGILSVLSYEEDDLTPIYAEGLSLYAKYKELFEEREGEITKDYFGIYKIDDKIFARDESEFFGKDLIEIPSLTSFDKETNLQLKLRLNFKKTPK